MSKPSTPGSEQRTPSEDRRQGTSAASTLDDATGGLYRKLSEFNLFDTLSNRFHSDDFNATRSEYIRTRVNILSIIFAIFAPLWIPIDYLLLTSDDAGVIAVYRLLLSIAMLGLLLTNNIRKRNLQHSLLCLTLLIIFPALFYTVCLLQLSGNDTLIGYSFIPFLLVAILSVFPLTLIEASVLGTGLIAALLCNDFFYGTLFTLSGFKDLWLISILLVIALWANQAQLHMLLRLYRQATRDPLTGLLNRRVMMERMKEMSKTWSKSEQPVVSVLMLDLDRFKRINDTYGHLTGDQVLQAFSQIMKDELRSTDILTRYGGEEFTAILPGSDMENASHAAERIRMHCEQSWVASTDNEPVRFTVSIGVGELKPGETFNDALHRVDNSLYEAKKTGRNKVVQAD
ncbi:GGDEF domain-containing protein [Oceanospirillum linum]|uniref:GGDEF domain-containing protein n=1 Tax=Oceanospirillum linum TaxID=966 RepID=UPI00089E4E15|nr:GGDEF domain-containing protein [Oceanospirillum linum]SEG26390.1 diguanylate cyclase (GGDEF) domain-containing protein [Oleiphilus messinensis]SMP27818.1 diguanylate cyclase (GGDEF) domain-containing protein [Oceanospirillum linum]